MDKQAALTYIDMAKEAIGPHWKKIASGILITISVITLGVVCCCISSAKNEPTRSCEAAQSISHEIPDTCPWQLVMSDLTHRLRLLEMAFKEQVIAREVIAAEVTNQSYSNLELERKLEEFVSTMKQLSIKLDKLKEQMTELTSRLYSDECLGFLVLVFVVVQIILAIRTKISEKQRQGDGVKVHMSQTHNGSTSNVPRSLSNSSLNGISLPSPKQKVSFKHEVCILAFSKSSLEEGSAQVQTLLTCVMDGIKLPSKTSYIIDSPEALKECPRAKAYLVLVDCQSLNGDSSQGEGTVCGSDAADPSMNVGCQENLNLQLSLLQVLNSFAGHIILVLMNDPGSLEILDLSMYNSSLPLIQSHDILQELASNGRVFSIWKDFSLHQLSQIKKLGKTLFSVKGK